MTARFRGRMRDDVRAVKCVGVRSRRCEAVQGQATAAMGRAEFGRGQPHPRRNPPAALGELQPQSRRLRSVATPPAEALKPHPATPREMRGRRSHLPLRSVQPALRVVRLRRVRVRGCGSGGCGCGWCRSSGFRDQRIDVLLGRRDHREECPNRRCIAFVRKSLAQHAVPTGDKLHYRLVGLDLRENLT